MEVVFVVCGYCGANAKVEGNKCLQRTDCEGTGLADDDVVSLSINHGRGPLLRWHDGDKDPYARCHKDHCDVVDKKKGKKTRRDPRPGEDIGDVVGEERNEAEKSAKKCVTRAFSRIL
ncbi:MAG: hypothetical protein J6Y19_11510 [Kiritimatiellae bacterium]|nr:hypothetical protein [Kiritimatiellia bacterium]